MQEVTPLFCLCTDDCTFLDSQKSIDIEEDETDIEIDDGFKETELKEENSKMVDDSILIPFGRPSEVGSSLVDVIACQIEKRGLV